MKNNIEKINETIMMKALVFNGTNDLALEDKPKPILLKDTDAIVRITTTSICGTDLHILKGDVPTIMSGRTLGHEGVGFIDEIGSNVVNFKKGDKVLISLITSCGRCDYCKKAMYAHCLNGGWQLGNSIDGTQAEYVRIPFADNSLYLLTDELDEESAVLLSCNLPTGFECGTQNGEVKPGDTLAIVGAGPVGLASLITSQLYSPSEIFVIGLDENRLEVARSLGATQVINSSDGKAVDRIMELTKNTGVDVVIEAAGIPLTFDICQSIIGTGGRIANIGVHGKPVELHLEKLWSSNITIRTGLVDAKSTPMLLSMLNSGKLEVKKLISHHFELSEIIKAYDTFENAIKEHALKVIIKNSYISK